MDTRGINQEHKIVYVALGRQTGLTDLNLQPYDEAGAAFGSPILFTELANGAYEASFTPDAEGIWRVRVYSTTNGDDAIKAIEVTAVELDMVSESVEETLDNTEAIKTETDKIPATIVKVDAIKAETDKIQTIDDNVDAVKLETDKIQTIDDNVDSVKTTVETIDTNVDGVVSDVTAIKTKTDNLPANTAAEFDEIDTDIAALQSDVTIIKNSVGAGGYFA